MPHQVIVKITGIPAIGWDGFAREESSAGFTAVGSLGRVGEGQTAQAVRRMPDVVHVVYNVRHPAL